MQQHVDSKNSHSLTYTAIEESFMGGTMTTEEMAYFHTRYDLLVGAVCRRICQPKDCCDDLYLDTFASIFKRTRPAFTDASDEKNWLVGICVSGYREMLRYRKRRVRLSFFMRDPPPRPDCAHVQSIRPLSEFLQDEKEQQLMDRVCRLPEKDRLPILLFYFLDKQASVVASVLHISQRAVLARLHQVSAILADQRLDETLHSSLRWHEAEKQTEEDAAFKKVAKLVHPTPTKIMKPAGETERRRKHSRWILSVLIPLVLILIGALSFSRLGVKQTPEPGSASFSDFLGSADAYVYPVTPEKTPEIWKTLGSHDAMIEACQIPGNLLSVMSTEGLVDTCLNYPLAGDMMAFNSPIVWLAGAIKNFNGLQELLQRKDAGIELLSVYQRVDYGALCKSGLSPNVQFGFLSLLLAQDRVLRQLDQRQRQDLLEAVFLQEHRMGDEGQDIGSFFVASQGILVGKILLLYAPELAVDLLSQHPNWKQLIETGQFMTVSPEEWKEILNQLNPVSPTQYGNGDPEKEIFTRQVFEQLLENVGLHPVESALPLDWTLKEVRSITYNFENTDIVTLDLFVCSSKERQEALYDYYRSFFSMSNGSYPLKYYGVNNLLIFITYSGQRAVRGMSNVENVILRIALGS